MTTPVPLDETSAVHDGTTFDLHYQLTGPPVAAPYSSTFCCPETARVRVVFDMEGVRVERLTVRGARARKDGLPGKLRSEIDFWPGGARQDSLPEYLGELCSQAETQVRRWLWSS